MQFYGQDLLKKIQQKTEASFTHTTTSFRHVEENLETTDLKVNDFRFVFLTLVSGDLGFAESYINGYIETQNIVKLLTLGTLNEAPSSDLFNALNFRLDFGELVFLIGTIVYSSYALVQPRLNFGENILITTFGVLTAGTLILAFSINLLLKCLSCIVNSKSCISL